MHHGSRVVTVVGHADCAGNPVDEERHKTDIAKSVVVIKEIISKIVEGERVEVLGLYVSPGKETSRFEVKRIEFV